MNKIAWHLGLGDAIICAPIIAKWAEKERILVPCWEHNFASVKSLFSGLNVEVFIVKSENDVISNAGNLRLGYSGEKLSQRNFIQMFFNQAGMGIEERIKYCPIKKASELIPQNKSFAKDYNFVHDDRFPINIVGTRSAMTNNSILSYVGLIENAKEVHCVDSSFLHLTDAISPKGKLFYHQYARPNSTPDFWFRKNWEVLTKAL
jgi:hypothetical protein